MPDLIITLEFDGETCPVTVPMSRGADSLPKIAQYAKSALLGEEHVATATDLECLGVLIAATIADVTAGYTDGTPAQETRRTVIEEIVIPGVSAEGEGL